jgi:hypothetical protein
VNESALNRFMDKVDIDYRPDGCWTWNAYTQSDGYGRFWLNRKLVSAHRAIYEHAYGDVPDGRELDHLCRNRSCVRPEHLEAVTRKENLRRGLAGALKEACAQGHPWIAENIAVRTLRSGRVMRRCLPCERDYWHRVKDRRNAARRKSVATADRRPM